jgi:tripartite-type tricarboxylate transporter receptor subunit TctC
MPAMHRPFIALVAYVALITPIAAATGARAESYPVKPVRVIVGLAPGGGTDYQARLFAQKLAENLRQQFIVDNRLGAGGLIAYHTAANAAPDGYTLLVCTPVYTIAPAFNEKSRLDPLRDFAPVSLLTKAPYLVVVHPAFPGKSFSDLIAFAKTQPLNFGVSGLGTTIHLGAAWIAQATRANFVIVPYKGTGPALNDLLGAQIHATFANILNVSPHIKSGRLRALAVSGGERSRVMPALPTIAASGVPGFDVTTWHGWLAPAGTPAAILERLHAELATFLRTPALAEKLAVDGGEAVGNTPAEYRRFLLDEIARWRRLAKSTGLKFDQ